MRWLLLLCVMLAAGAVGCGAPPRSKAEVVASDWQPEWNDLDGRVLRPFDDPNCRAVVLIFLMQDCPIANSYVPEFNRLHAEFGPRGMALILVQTDPALTAAEAAEHRRQYEIAAPVVLDSRHDWVRRAGATRTPEAAVFSRAGKRLYLGRIDDRYVGPSQRRPEATQRDLQRAIEAILAGREGEVATTQAVGCYIPDLPKEMP